MQRPTNEKRLPIPAPHMSNPPPPRDNGPPRPPGGDCHQMTVPPNPRGGLSPNDSAPTHGGGRTPHNSHLNSSIPN